MKIYIVMQGEYENNDIYNATTDYQEALKSILKIYDYKGRIDKVGYSEAFADMRVWENGKELYCYGRRMGNAVSGFVPLTLKQLDIDVQKHVSESV